MSFALRVRDFATKIIMYNRPFIRRFPIIRYVSSKTEAGRDKKDDAPPSYLKSAAAQWPARYSRTMGTDDKLWYEPYVVSLSLAVFLIYFTILREENDIDEKLAMPLFKTVPSVEKLQLESARQYSLDNGLDVKNIDKRLAEIASENSQSSA